jgi:hypothetical protein
MRDWLRSWLSSPGVLQLNLQSSPRDHGHSQQAFRESPTALPPSSSIAAPAEVSHTASVGSPWQPEAVAFHRARVMARLAAARCVECGGSLEGAPVRELLHATFHDDCGLSDMGAARLLAATESRLVECARCGARNRV